jgi:thiol-disulfide isomerase/thioredoxin|nr:TlpA disulfide reductase family protein [Kofleriaceae bacterium]
MTADASGTADAGRISRFGLAIVNPARALGGAARREHAGRSGSDLLVMIVVVLAAVHLRALVAAAWLGLRIDGGMGVRAVIGVLADALAIDFTFLAIAAVALYAASGRRRDLGRAFDLACVAVLPLLYVELVSTVVVRALDTEVPIAVAWLLAGLAYAWCGGLVALGVIRFRTPEVSGQVARGVGLGVLGVALIGAILQVVFVVQHVDDLRPMSTGDDAPKLALPRIEAGGKLGEPFALNAQRGRPVIVDFWATWCKPCLMSLPALDRFQRAHPDAVVVSVDLDDAAAARALFDDKHYSMTLLMDDGDTANRFGVSAIPHLVFVDRGGVVRDVVRGGGADLADLYERYGK